MHNISWSQYKTIQLDHRTSDIDKNTQDPFSVYGTFGRSCCATLKKKKKKKRSTFFFFLSPGDLHMIFITENLVKQRRRTYPNPSSLLPLLSSVKLKNKSFLKVASCLVLLIISAKKAQSLAHRCQRQTHGCRLSAKQEARATRENRQGCGRAGPPLPES